MNIEKLKKIAELSPNADKANEAMKSLKAIDSSYHWCPDWDLMVICNSDPENEGCTCVKSPLSESNTQNKG